LPYTSRVLGILVEAIHGARLGKRATVVSNWRADKQQREMLHADFQHA
jgi:hypothetical protein